MNDEPATYPWIYTSFTKEVEILREHFRRDPKCHFVLLTDFCRLLTSTLQLERSDERKARLVGLSDSSTGVRYFIEFEKLGVCR